MTRVFGFFCGGVKSKSTKNLQANIRPQHAHRPSWVRPHLPPAQTTARLDGSGASCGAGAGLGPNATWFSFRPALISEIAEHLRRNRELDSVRLFAVVRDNTSPEADRHSRWAQVMGTDENEPSPGRGVRRTPKQAGRRMTRRRPVHPATPYRARRKRHTRPDGWRVGYFLAPLGLSRIMKITRQQAMRRRHARPISASSPLRSA